LDIFITIFVAAIAAIILVPVFVGVYITVRINRNESMITDYLKIHGYMDAMSEKQELEGIANRLVEGNAYGNYILHCIMKSQIEGNQIYFYKKIRHFTVRLSMDLKEFMFPIGEKRDRIVVVFFGPASFWQKLRNMYEDRQPGMFVGKNLYALPIDGALQKAGVVSVYGNTETSLNSMLNSSQYDALLHFQSIGVFSFMIIGEWGMISFDPFRPDIQIGNIHEAMLSLL
jgi:hypothetical protein